MSESQCREDKDNKSGINKCPVFTCGKYPCDVCRKGVGGEISVVL